MFNAILEALIIKAINADRAERQEVMDRVAAWIQVYEANSPWSQSDATGASYESAPLLLSDLKKLAGVES